MLNDNLDKYIKENLENARLDWDKESMWDDIESQLPIQEKDRKWFFILLGLLFLVISGAGGYLLLNNLSVTDDINLQEQAYESTATTEVLMSSQDQNVSPTITKEEVVQIIEEESENTSEIEEDLLNTNTEAKEVSTTTAIPTIINRDENIGSVSIRNKTTKSNSINNTSNISDNVDNKNQPDIISQKQIVNAQIASLRLLYGSGLGVVRISERKIPYIANTTKVLIPQVNTNNGWQLGIYSGIGMTNRHLESQNNESLLELREQNESTLEVLTTGLKIRKTIADRFFIDAGIEYQRINEKLDYTEEEIITISTETDSAYVANVGTGSQQYFSGRIDATFTRSQRSIRYNAHHNLNVPIHVGYSNIITPRLTLSAYTGPVINLYQDYSGYNIAADGFVEQSGDIQGVDLVHAFDAGFSVDYALGRRMDLSLGAFYRKALSTFSIDGNVSQSYDNTNIQVGILYNFY